MLRLRSDSYGFLIVIIVSVGAALFRVANAPERAGERRDMAYKTCVRSGGERALVVQTEFCRQSDGLWLPGP